MKLLLLSDDRPGHANLSEGIAAAIARHHTVSIERMDVSRGRWPGPVAALATRSVFSDARILSTIYGINPDELPAADIVISAGSETLAANICAARLLGAQNIFYGSLRQYRASDFTLVLTSYRQLVKGSNVVQAMKPSALDPDTIPAVEAGQAPRCLGLLVGGPSGGINYTKSDWQQLSDLLTATKHQAGIAWIVSNSRRTPHEATALLRDLATEDGPIRHFINVDDPGGMTLPDLFRDVDGVVCTADSSSMISEVIWARRPLLAVSPSMFRLTRKEAEYRKWLGQSGWYASASLATLSADDLIARLASTKPLTENPLDWYAALLGQHLDLEGRPT